MTLIAPSVDGAFKDGVYICVVFCSFVIVSWFSNQQQNRNQILLIHLNVSQDMSCSGPAASSSFAHREVHPKNILVGHCGERAALMAEVA